MARLHEFSRAVDGAADARISTTAAEVTGHSDVDVRVGGGRIAGEQCGSGHDLSRLTVAALRDIQLHPGSLHGVGTVRGDTLDGGDFAPCHGFQRKLARTDWLAIQMDRASAA